MKRIEYIPKEIINGFIFLKEVAPYVKPCGKKERKATFVCVCNKEFDAIIQGIKSGSQKSCGCSNDGNPTHWLSKHPLYRVWANMKNRCYNKNNPRYKDYGGRGVTVCNEWQNDPKVFIEWALENGYRDGLHLDKDILGNGLLYSSKTCKFVTPTENVQNTRVSKLNWHLVNEIRNIKLLIPKITSREIATAYNISGSVIRKLLNNKTWVAV